MKRYKRWLIVLFALLILFFIYQVRAILTPFILGLVIAFLLDPFLDKLQARGFTRTKAIGLVYAVFLIIFVGIALFVVPKIANELNYLIKNFPKYNQLQDWLVNLSERANGSQLHLDGHFQLHALGFITKPRTAKSVITLTGPPLINPTFARASFEPFSQPGLVI